MKNTAVGSSLNRRCLRFLVLVLAICLSTAWAPAHDGWVEVTPTIIEKGQVANLALIQGNHSNEHKSYRIAGKWDGRNTTLAVVDPRGKQIMLTDRVIDLGEDEEKVGPKGPKGFYLASYIPNDDAFTRWWRGRCAACNRRMDRSS